MGRSGGVIGIGLWVLPRTCVLLSDATNVHLKDVPGAIKFLELGVVITGVPRVTGVHALQVWSITNDEINCTSHVGLSD